MKLARLAVNRPVTIWMGVAAILLLGFVSLGRLPIDLLPNIEAPVLAIATNYPNAGPEEVENLVSRVVEEALSGVNNITSVTSVSSRGRSIVIAGFDWGLDMDFVALEVRERIDLIRDFLPDEADSPTIARFDPSATPIMQLVLRGDKTPFELRQRAVDLQGQLERIEGVASVSVSGGQEREIQVVLHPGLMQSSGVTMDGVSQSLRAANLNLPAGSVVDREREYVLRTTGEFTSVDQVRDVRIPTMTGGMTRLTNVADVVDGFKEITQRSRYNGQPSVTLSIQKEAAANSVQVADRVLMSIDELNRELSRDGFMLELAQDVTEFIRASVRSVTENALIGGVLAVIMLLLFLRSFRSTIVIGVAIPISVVAAFVLMYFSSITLNMVSLGGLALGVGMLVDNGIVVLENIYRHREQGEDSQTAAENGTTEVGSAIMASTLTTVSVFLPVIFVSGIAAEIFRDLALTVTFSLVGSLLISLTLVPMLASRLLGGKRGAAAIPWMSFMDHLVGRLQAWYAESLTKVLRYRWAAVGLAVVILGATLLMVPQIGTEFMPALDQGDFSIRIAMPMGTRLVDTDRVVRRFEEYLAGVPEVESVSSTSGSGGNENGRLAVTLAPLRQRDRSTDEVVVELRQFAATIPEADVTVRMDGMFAGSFGAPIQVEVRGDDLAQLQQVADGLVGIVAAVPGAQEVRNTMAERQPEIRIEIDREKVAAYGVTVGQVASTVRTAVSGTTVTRFRTGGREVDVTVRLGENWRENPSHVENVPVQTGRGNLVPLKELASLSYGEGPVSIDRSDRSRLVTVTGEVYGRDLGSVMDDLRVALDEVALPTGVSYRFGGENEEMNEAFGQLLLAMLLGVALVYMILASQFESLMQPFVIMITLPLAIIGVVLGLIAARQTFSVVSYVGAIMLAGIVVNNAIVLIDYVNQLRAQGLDVQQALVEGGRTRLRPILMTTLTTVLGMFPLALGLGEGNELQQPIAVVVIGGLLTSTVLTLFMIPVFYLLFDRLAVWARSMVRTVVSSDESASQEH